MKPHYQGNLNHKKAEKIKDVNLRQQRLFKLRIRDPVYS